MVLTGHSLGAGAACLLAFLFYEHVDGGISSRLEIPTSMIECWGFGCPPCVDKLLSEHAPFIKNVVLQVYDEKCLAEILDVHISCALQLILHRF